MKKKLLIFLLLFSALWGQKIHSQLQDDTLFIYRNIIENNDKLTLNEQKNYIDKAIKYSESKKYIYEELYFKEKEIGYYFSVVDYGILFELTNNLLKDVEENFGKGSTYQNWKELHIKALYNLAITNAFTGDNNKATEAFYKISSNYPEDSLAQAKVYNGFGIISAHKNAFESALDNFEKSLELYSLYDDKDGMFKAYSNIGLLYLNQGRYTESLSNFLKAHQIVIETGATGEKQIYANHYMAMAYSGMENYEMANRFFIEAIKLAEEKQYKRLLCFSQFNYSKNLYKQKNYTQAEIECKKSLIYFEESNMISMVAECYSLLSKIYAETGDYKSGLESEKKYAELLYNFLKAEKEENFQKLESSLENYKLQNKLIDLELTKAKVSNRNLLIVLLSLLSFLLLAGVIILYRRFFRVSKINNLTQKHLDEVRKSNKERIISVQEYLNKKIDSKNKELLTHALLLLKLSSVSSSIMEIIQTLKKSVSFKPKEKMLIYEMENLISELSLDNDWGEVDMYFEQIYKGFFDKLTEQYPSLSTNEKRLCALFSLDLNNKDIATLMQKSLQSVSMAKIRIKRKLNIESNEELVTLLNSL